MAKQDYFNTYGVKPTYKDPDTLKKFLTPRGKILGRDKSGLTAKNQRKLAEEIKHARYLALLSYTSTQEDKMRQLKK